MSEYPLLKPVFAMALLTMGVAIVMVVTRVRAMKRLHIHPQKGQDTTMLRALLPNEVNRAANNYNHLFEQPVLFYLVCISISLIQDVSQTTIVLAWLYTAVRYIHSMVQISIDWVMLRFSLFLLSWVLLSALIIKATLSVWSI